MGAKILRGLAWVAGGVLVLVVLAVLFLAFIFNWDWVRGPAEHLAGRSLGRGVSVGHLAIDLGWVTGTSSPTSP